MLIVDRRKLSTLADEPVSTGYAGALRDPERRRVYGKLQLPAAVKWVVSGARVTGIATGLVIDDPRLSAIL
jgi:hypothetical protein